MLLTALICLAQAHDQNFDNQDCVGVNGTIHVGTAVLSQSYYVKDSLCTFEITASTIDALSVSRIERHAGGGYVRLQDGQTLHEQKGKAHGEPFAIVPMYSTIDEKETAGGTITVYVPGKALVSFGQRENYQLVLATVVSDAYDTREFVYDAPPWTMYALHACLLILVLLEYMPLIHWILISCVVDCLLWAILVWVEMAPGAFFNWIVVLRLTFLAYLSLKLWPPRWLSAVLAYAYVTYVLAWSDVSFAYLYFAVPLVLGCLPLRSLLWVDCYPLLLYALAVFFNVGMGAIGLASCVLAWRQKNR